MLNKITFNSVANNFHQHEVVFCLYNDRLVREIRISNICLSGKLCKSNKCMARNILIITHIELRLWTRTNTSLRNQNHVQYQETPYLCLLALFWWHGYREIFDRSNPFPSIFPAGTITDVMYWAPMCGTRGGLGLGDGFAKIFPRGIYLELTNGCLAPMLRE